MSIFGEKNKRFNLISFVLSNDLIMLNSDPIEIMKESFPNASDEELQNLVNRNNEQEKIEVENLRNEKREGLEFLEQMKKEKGKALRITRKIESKEDDDIDDDDEIFIPNKKQFSFIMKNSRKLKKNDMFLVKDEENVSHFVIHNDAYRRIGGKAIGLIDNDNSDPDSEI